MKRIAKKFMMPQVFMELNNTGASVAKWLLDAVNGNSHDYGLALLDEE
ncbi:hypothetical protein H7U37_12675 [Pseudoflavonifractor phocaeensis]|nr:hypothetical protein [Pseudoflavonifractor phocaeensis]MBM6939369.1 hypothetical protein [Pseudoflavonifractor phocaeensis]